MIVKIQKNEEAAVRADRRCRGRGGGEVWALAVLKQVEAHGCVLKDGLSLVRVAIHVLYHSMHEETESHPVRYNRVDG